MADSWKGSELPPGGEHIPLDTESNPTAQSTSQMRSVQLGDVPNVEVRAKGADDTSQTEHQSEASLGPNAREVPYSQLNPEQQRALKENLKREQAKKYFSLREGAFQKAVEECKLSLIDSAADGDVLSAWLLTEIDHWDLEKERIVLITDKQLVIAKYNFIGIRVEDHRKIPLIKCDKVQTGRFAYPKNTMMMLTGYAENSPRTKQSGLRIHFGHFEPSLLQSWNPWSSNIPYVTFADHMLSQLVDQPPSHLLLKGFQKAVVDAISAAREAVSSQPSVGSPLQVTEEEIPIWLYIGITAMVNNQSKLGYCKDRGSVFW